MFEIRIVKNVYETIGGGYMYTRVYMFNQHIFSE